MSGNLRLSICLTVYLSLELTIERGLIGTSPMYGIGSPREDKDTSSYFSLLVYSHSEM